MWKPIPLFSVLGIPVRVHGSLLIFLVLAAFLFNLGSGLAGFVATGVFLALVFSFVLLHELGHAVVALYHRVPVAAITLYPLGGIARLEHMPREPHKELAIALAGPAVNFLLAGAFALVHFIVPGAFLSALIEVNLMLALFNLLPGFPLDGGRVLRALLARRRSYAEATRIAVRVGKAVAVGLGIVGLVALHPMLILIAAFIFFAAQAELLQSGAVGNTFSDGDPLRRSSWPSWRARQFGAFGRHPSGWGRSSDALRAHDHSPRQRTREGSLEGWRAGRGIVIDIDPDGRIRRIWR